MNLVLIRIIGFANIFKIKKKIIYIYLHLNFSFKGGSYYKQKKMSMVLKIRHDKTNFKIERKKNLEPKPLGLNSEPNSFT